MITSKQLTDLKIGDVIEVGVLLPLVLDEQLVWMCVSKEGEGADTIATFDVSYFGVWFTRFNAHHNNKLKVIFKEVV